MTFATVLTPANVETDARKAKSGIVWVCRVVAERASVWHEGDTEGNPEGTEGAEDDAGEGVTQDPLAGALAIVRTGHR